VGDDPDRPYVLLSCAMSLDGHLDDATGQRLLLSDAEDADRVDGVRADCDAILVGAGTIRRDDPLLLVRSPGRRTARVASGRPGSPAKVTLTGTGDLDPAARFFTAGDADKLVYAASSAVDGARLRLGGAAAVLDGGDPVDLDRVLADLAGRGVRRLMVEGGTTVLTGFLAAGLADELQLVVAPFLVGDSRAPRLVADGDFRWDARHRAGLTELRRIGDLVLLRYALSDRCGPR
jgi:5-amino-6-(5-phosphoribosylamino)uracil reductase